MSFLPIQYRHKVFIIPSDKCYSVFTSWPEHEQKKLTEVFGDNIPDVTMVVTLGENNTPAELRLRTSEGKISILVDGQDLRHREITSIAFYTEMLKLDWERMPYLDFERTFPNTYSYKVWEPVMATLISEVRAVKNLLIEWQKSVKPQDELD